MKKPKSPQKNTVKSPPKGNNPNKLQPVNPEKKVSAEMNELQNQLSQAIVR